MVKLIDIANKVEARRKKVLALWDELIPNRRSYAEIAKLAGMTKGNVHYIIKGRKSRAKTKALNPPPA